MLSSSDAQLAARDRELPGLSLLLDPEAFASALREAFSAEHLTAVQARYARYKPATNCMVAYTVSCRGQEVDVYAKAYHPGSSKLEKAACRMTAESTLGPAGTVLEKEGVAIFVYPNDARLPLLQRLQSPGKRARTLAGLLPQHIELGRAESRRIRYKPERRYVERITGPDADLLLRLYNCEDYARARSSAGIFTSGRRLRVARCLSTNDEKRALVMQWLPGHPLDDAYTVPGFDVSHLQQVGQALAELHAQDTSTFMAITTQDRCSGVQTAARAVSAVRPGLAERAERLAQTLTPRLLQAPAMPRPIHGDFSSDQVLLQDDGGIGIIDFDAAGLGDPVADLGSFAAHLQREVVRNRLSASQADALTRELRQGYGPHTGFETNCAAALLHLAYSPFRYREPDWAGRVETLLTRAEEMTFHA